nr:T9SS type A sorting domain-containing protein [Bacteroidota bacterium]
GGDSWEKILVGSTSFDPFKQNAAGTRAQGDFDNTIAVDPANPDRIFIGGVHFIMGRKIGGTWQFDQVAGLTRFFDENNTTANPYYIHADKHNIVFDTKSSPAAMYVSSDGGIFKSVDYSFSNAPTYKPVNNGYSTIQFYAVAVSPYNKYELIGGTQDNGTLRLNRSGFTQQNAKGINPNDGGYTAISKINGNIYIAESQYGDIRRSLDQGDDFKEFFDVNVPEPGETRYPFLTPFALWENLNDAESRDSIEFFADRDYTSGETIIAQSINKYPIEKVLTSDLDSGASIMVQDIVQSKFFVGAYNGIYMTQQALVFGVTPPFVRIANLPGFIPVCMEYTEDGDVLFVGGKSGGTGRLYRISGLRGKIYKQPNFSPDSVGITTELIYSSPSQPICGLGVDPNNREHIVVALGGYGFGTHVVRSKDAATATTPAFANITGALPDFPVYDAAISQENNNHYILATEAGVWASQNGGGTWTEENNGMERVPSFMIIQWYQKDQPWEGPVFYVATHGRGIFMTETFVTGVNEKYAPANTQLNVYPNPARDITNIDLSLTQTSDVIIQVFDIQGRMVEQKNYSKQASGENSYQLNVSGYTPGTYFIRIRAGVEKKSSKLLVID